MNKARRILFMVLALLMVLGVTACQTSDPTTPPVAQTSAAAVATAAPVADATDDAEEEEAPISLYEEHLTVTGAIFMESFTTDLVKDDLVTKYIMDKFNVTLEIIEGGAESAWIQKAPALIAGEDLPDIFLLFNQGGTGINGMMQTLITANSIENLDPYLESDLPVLVNDPYMVAAIEYQRKMTSPDGSVYAVPSCVGIFDTPKNPVVANSIRWDVYKEIGTPEITDMNSFLDVLKQMQDAYPQTPDGQSVYAVSGWFGASGSWGEWCVNAPFDGPQGVSGGTNPVFMYIDETSLSPVDNYREDGSPFWQRIEWYYKANQMGILDPDAWTMEQDNWIQKVEDGRILFIQPGWEPSQRNPILESKFGSDVGFVSLPPFPDAKAYQYQSWNIGGERLYSIPTYANDAVKIRAMAILNWQASEEGALVGNNGPEGLAWEVQNGKAVVTQDDYRVAGQYDNDMRLKYGANVYHHFKGYADATFMPSYGAPANLRFDPDSVLAGTTSYELEALDYYGAKAFNDENYFGRVYNLNMFPLVAAIPTLPEDLMRARTALNDVVYKYRFAMILAKDDAEFASLKAEFLAEIDKNNYDEIRQWSYDHEAEISKQLIEIVNPLKAAIFGN